MIESKKSDMICNRKEVISMTRKAIKDIKVINNVVLKVSALDIDQFEKDNLLAELKRRLAVELEFLDSLNNELEKLVPSK